MATHESTGDSRKGRSMKPVRAILLSVLGSLPSLLAAGSSLFLTFPVLPDPSAGALGALAVQNAGVCVVRDQSPGQIAYQMAGQDGSGIGRIYSNAGTNCYALTDIGSQFPTSVVSNQSILSVIECFEGRFGWNGPAFVAGLRETVDGTSVIDSKLDDASGITLTAVPIPTLLQGSSSQIDIQLPPYRDAGGQAIALQVWRQGSNGIWSPLAQLPLTTTAQNYVDGSVLQGASYWYGVSVVFAWPGGSGEGAIPTAMGQYVSKARSVSAMMVAADVQPSPTASPTMTPSPVVTARINHDLGQAGWAAGPNPSRNGQFRIQFHTEKPATWQLSVFTVDGLQAKQFQGSVPGAGWQLEDIGLPKQASGIYLMQLRVTQEGGVEKTLPMDKVAIIR